MARKILKITLLTLAVLTIFACKQKTTHLTEDELVKAIFQKNNGELELKPIEEVMKLIESNPQSIDFDFEEWENEPYNFFVSVCTSDDGKIRIYDFETYQGGNSNYGFFNARHLLQYRSDYSNEIYCRQIIPASKFVYDLDEEISDDLTTTAIYPVDDDGWFYLIIFSNTSINSWNTEILTEKIIAVDDAFEKNRIFKTKYAYIDEISIEYVDYSTDEHIIYNSEEKKLYIPLIDEDKYFGQMQKDKNLVYQWKGDYFEYIGIESNLHPSIENFESKELIFETSKFLIRIDEMENGKYRYASWSNDKTMKDKPDLIIENGIIECWNEIGECDCDEEDGVSGIKYIFENGEYKYIYEAGWWKGGMIDELYVLKNGKEILREKTQSY